VLEMRVGGKQSDW